MVGICFITEPRSYLQDQWSFLFSNFGVDDLWEITREPGEKIYQPTIKIDTADNLPTERPVVVLAPQTGKYVQGTEDLTTFEHPENAIYLFGASHRNLSEDELGVKVIAHSVYIPLVQYECYSHAAAYMTLWDRYVKRGEHG